MTTTNWGKNEFSSYDNSFLSTTLQQYDLYVQAMEQVKGKRPLHILPDFLAAADQGRSLFALGSIFGLYSQGTFFYYWPADPLEAAGQQESSASATNPGCPQPTKRGQYRHHATDTR